MKAFRIFQKPEEKEASILSSLVTSIFVRSLMLVNPFFLPLTWVYIFASFTTSRSWEPSLLEHEHQRTWPCYPPAMLGVSLGTLLRAGATFRSQGYTEPETKTLNKGDFKELDKSTKHAWIEGVDIHLCKIKTVVFEQESCVSNWERVQW